MLRKFKIKVDGEEYLVEMEEIGGVPVVTPDPQNQPTVEEVPVVSTPAPAPVAASEDAMTSPMPGTILKLLVSVGDTVSENQPLLILEAMKMENEIVCKKSGVVQGIHVTQGDVVNAGDALITVV